MTKQSQSRSKGYSTDISTFLAVIGHDLRSPLWAIQGTSQLTRNPLSEAFQKRLDAAHAQVLRRFAALRDPEALQTAWAAALEENQMPGALWALLTHPLGAALESKLLYDARAWVFAHGRRSVDLSRTRELAGQRAEDAQLQVADLRARLLAQQRQSAQALSLAQAEIARLNGELNRGQRITSAKPSSPFVPRVPAHPARVAPAARHALPVAAPPPQAPREVTAPRPQPIPVHGRRVLCVGGFQHAVARYLGRIEKLGTADTARPVMGAADRTVRIGLAL